MKVLISILVAVAVIFTGWRLWTYWEEVSQQKDLNGPSADANAAPPSIPRLPYELERSLEAAKRKGSTAFKEWLDAAQASQRVHDPRLAWIQLDYVVMISRENPVEAKRLFAEIKKRVEPDSPVYPRIQALQHSLD
jgi:hypothetical protein